jgi:hypothetical protein
MPSVALYCIDRHMYVSVARIGHELRFSYTDRPCQLMAKQEQWFKAYDLRNTRGLCLVTIASTPE